MAKYLSSSTIRILDTMRSKQKIEKQLVATRNQRIKKALKELETASKSRNLIYRAEHKETVVQIVKNTLLETVTTPPLFNSMRDIVYGKDLANKHSNSDFIVAITLGGGTGGKEGTIFCIEVRQRHANKSVYALYYEK